MMDYNLKRPAEHYQQTDAKDWPKPQPKAKEVFADMNEDMRRFLLAAMVSGVEPDLIGEDESHSYHPNTLRALKRPGLIRLVQTKKQPRKPLRPTDEGRGL